MACSTVRPPSCANTWSRASDPARTAPNSPSINSRKWLIRTRRAYWRRHEPWHAHLVDDEETTASGLVPQVWSALGGPPQDVHRLVVTGPARTLASRFPATAVGVAVIGAALLAATADARSPVALDTGEVA